MPQVDTQSYNKALKYPLPAPPALGHGFQGRKGAPSSVVIHTTNNRAPNTAFEQEARFLLDSGDVSAHYLLGKDGRIAQFLDPHPYAAWHAGAAIGPWLNEHSIGIELHVSISERPTKAQRDAAAWLCARLMAAYGFASDRIETHRYVAIPVGRKSDPEGWSNAEFYQWRAMLVSAAPDPWVGWGQAYPLDPAQRGWKVPQTWLRNTWLGEARSYELYTPDGLRSSQSFVNGWIYYEKLVDWAMAYKASKPVP